MRSGTAWGLAFAMAAVFGAGFGWAGEGQADLDKALELKIRARDVRQFAEVVSLCEAAIKKGLDPDNEEFARKLLTGTLYQRVQQLCEPIFAATGPDDRWPLLRTAALKDLETIVEYDAQFSEAQLLIAQLQILPGGDRARAGKALAAILGNEQTDRAVQAKAHLLRGQLAENEAEQQAEFDRAVELDPGNADALRARALLHIRQGRTGQAMRDFEQLVQRNPDDRLARLAIVQTLIGLKQYDAALEQINNLLKQGPDAAARALRAELLALKGQPDEAIADLDDVLKAEPKDLRARLLRAQLCFQQRRNEQAAEDVRYVLQARPELPQAVALSSLITAAQGNADAAIELMENLVKQEPRQLAWQLQLAALNTLAGRPKRAIEIYTDILRETPDQADAARGRGNAYLELGQHREAIADYEVALKTLPDQAELLNNFAWVLATSPDEALRDGKRAVTLARKACELTDHKAAYMLSTLAAALAETGDFAAAQEWAAKAVELSDETVRQQLEQERASYEQGKPWRERKQPPEPAPPPAKQPTPSAKKTDA